MGAFLLGLIIGIAATLFFVIYDEGEAFLKLHVQIKRAMTRFKQPDTTPRTN
jgi:ABC-type nitrate/sulfonate/bicarbonate transport system permease component